MKTLFKTSLVALAVTGSFAANAATISTPSADRLTFTNEAVQAGLTNVDATADLVFDVIVANEHPAGSEIVFTFDSAVDLGSVTGGTCNAPTVGQFTCGSLTFDVGTGSFTFDEVEVDANAGTISFNVNLGNPLIANSAFRTTIPQPAIVVSGASSLQYDSNLAGAPIESGVGPIATQGAQFSYSIETVYNNRVDRIDYSKFSTFALAESANSDVATVKLIDAAADYKVAVTTAVQMNVAVNGALYDGTVGVNAANFITAGTGLTWDVAGPQDIPAAGGKVVGFTDNVTGMNKTTVAVFDFANTTEEIPRTAFTLDLSVQFDDSGATQTNTLAEKASFGEWALDASVVNIPYLPVGYSHLSSAIEYSNHGTAAASVQITAFDQDGIQYTGDLEDAAPKTVTHYKESVIAEALGLEGNERRKLNITFISDADEENVSIVPYYRENDSRVQTINDQYKGK
ncbi:hypothetical protein [Aliagarivorans marinus]|uniref:hypothetical protein n=1 Tax=Aliagarivorans marinus TaxID=561965 RepID=UPI00041BB81A|nr:hypothetical protein [Aliagarivorans marinus]